METQSIQGLTDLLLTKENLIIMVAVGTILSVLRKTLPELFKNKWVARFLPVYPILLCLGFIWIPGLRPVGMTAGATIILALIMGGSVGHIYKVLFQTVLGKDEQIPAPKTNVKPDEDSPVA